MDTEYTYDLTAEQVQTINIALSNAGGNHPGAD